ncbi:MAG: hypothetical protein LWY06_15715 [Firmicutes bacterium]|nr:hypothetical protein [Bacillota bacterium]
MKRKVLFGCLLALLFSAMFFSPAYAGSEYAERLMKTLGVSKKAGQEGLEQQRNLGQFMVTLSGIMNINTSLEMYKSDHGKFPDSLNKLMPSYLKSIPQGLSSQGNFPFVYEMKSGGKGYVVYCKGANFPDLNVPANFPRSESGKGDIADVYLKPGVVKPPYDARKASPDNKAGQELKACLMQFPDLIRKKDPVQAKKLKLQLTSLLSSNQLDDQEKALARNMIKTCEQIESGKIK